MILKPREGWFWIVVTDNFETLWYDFKTPWQTKLEPRSRWFWNLVVNDFETPWKIISNRFFRISETEDCGPHDKWFWNAATGDGETPWQWYWNLATDDFGTSWDMISWPRGRWFGRVPDDYCANVWPYVWGWGLAVEPRTLYPLAPCSTLIWNTRKIGDCNKQLLDW